MVTIQAYRVAIGTFLGIARKLSTTSNNMNRIHDVHCHEDLKETECFLRLIIIVLTLCTIYCNFSLASYKLLKLLLDGDIESNPGPTTYAISKTTSGSFHQADIRFGETAGTQCLCNSLLSISWSLVRRVALWSSVDLDFILIKGDALYKSFNKRGYLTFDELPCQVDTDAGIFNMHKLHNEAGIFQPRNKDNFLKCLSKDDRGHGMLFIVAGYSFAILWNKSNFFVCLIHIAVQVKVNFAMMELLFC